MDDLAARVGVGDGRPDPHSLVERLLALDQEVVRLRAERAPPPAPRPAERARAPAPRDGIAHHDWPLAEDPTLDPARLGVFDRRTDDDAILAARAGAAFLATLDERPSLAALRRAAAALEQGAARWHTPPEGQAPDVSVIVPVHGQARWTLNCLDGLLHHASRCTLEVIVVDDASPDGSAEVLQRLRVPGFRVVRQSRNAGFIATCNAGAAAAAGRILVLLNNDTRVAAGWLDALVDSFGWLPRAGLVGSKLLYPDGRLQEAGGIVWRDGVAWNFGRDEDANQPAACHAREADYVSGASIAVPAALWRELGGLDPHFAPAYCEDSDLAFRIRAAGRQVWFQPLSRVVHYEGRTGGTDVASGAKAHQVVNQKRLFVRWHATLAGHGGPADGPYFARERGVTRRALVVDASTPTPQQDAGSVTTVLTIRLLQRLGYKVHFVPQDNFLFQPGPTGELQRIGVECAYAPYDMGFPDYIARYGRLFDLVLVFRPAVLDRVLAELRRHAPQAVLLFNTMDLHYLRRQREAEVAGDPVALAEAAAAKRAELRLLAEADVTITPSTHEQEILALEAPAAAVAVQPFLFEAVGTAVGFGPRRDFVFLGGYGHPPNVDAAGYFVAKILPLIRRELPGARVVLAGAKPTPAMLALAGPGIEVPGLVDDLGTLFDAARVFVCPLRAGAGVKGKVVAAMAHGLPVVSTGCGAEGMGLTAGQELLVADGEAAFARACVRLHQDAALWAALSAAGLAYVERTCSLESGKRALAAAIDRGWQRKLGLDGAERDSARSPLNGL